MPFPTSWLPLPHFFIDTAAHPALPSPPKNPPHFGRGDLDGFFGLFIDNLLQLMLIGAFGTIICGFSPAFIADTILPGAAISLLVGNLFYAWQARQLMKKTGRTDITALPYGINTVSLIAFVFFVMGPVYHDALANHQSPEAAAKLAWEVGLFATLFSGVMEIICAFIGDWIRRVTPRAALLAALAGIAIGFIAMGFVFQIFASPILSLLPLLIILIAYASKIRLPLGLPGGFVALLIGIAIAWGSRLIHHPVFTPPTFVNTLGFHYPHLVLGPAFKLLFSPLGFRYMAVIFPMGLFNVVGSLQNLESAEAAGDRFPTMPSLLMNGIGSVVAACFGSPFPTTIYIGHPGWKAIGARSAYSSLNGIVITILCLAGGLTAVLQIVPIEAALGILVWVGVIITAQAFQEVPKNHALAVAMGLIPALAAWGVFLVQSTLRVTSSTLEQVAGAMTDSQFFIHGAIALSQGFLLTAMIFAAVVVFLIEHRFAHAALWLLLASLLSFTGVIHAYTLDGNDILNHYGLGVANDFAVMYLIGAGIMVLLHFRHAKTLTAMVETSEPAPGVVGQSR